MAPICPNYSDLSLSPQISHSTEHDGLKRICHPDRGLAAIWMNPKTAVE
jgi:hypothetical protein